MTEAIAIGACKHFACACGVRFLIDALLFVIDGKRTEFASIEIAYSLNAINQLRLSRRLLRANAMIWFPRGRIGQRALKSSSN